jgi:hypothetical protein
VRHTSALSRQPIKKRRLAGTPFATVTNIVDIDSEEEEITKKAQEEEEAEGVYPPEGSRRRALVPLSSEVGEQTVNKSRGSKSASSRREGSGKGKGKEKAQDDRRSNSIRADVFETEEDESSPRKRKRSDIEEESESEDEGDTSSWLNMDEDEAEPEFIAESESRHPRFRIMNYWLMNRRSALDRRGTSVCSPSTEESRARALMEGRRDVDNGGGRRSHE